MYTPLINPAVDFLTNIGFSLYFLYEWNNSIIMKKKKNALFYGFAAISLMIIAFVEFHESGRWS